MAKTSDVQITLPTEHFGALSAVIASGLKHASISSDERRELQAWWTAEKEFVEDAIENGD